MTASPTTLADSEASGSPPPPGGRPIVLVLGATSEIARGVCTALARAGYDLFLAGRDPDELEREGSDLGIRYGAESRTFRFDALEDGDHEEFVGTVLGRAGGRLAGVVLAFGLLGDEERARRDVGHALEIVEVNFLGAVSVLTHFANHFEDAGDGFIAALSSVAGDRGRRGNYTYGAAKGALSLWLQGLRSRLHDSGVRVLTVKPGFVDTRMTFGREGLFLEADPEKVGESIVRAIRAGRDVAYVPWFWRYIMLAIRLIPERVFKRLEL